jgi:hypothetical protein
MQSEPPLPAASRSVALSRNGWDQAMLVVSMAVPAIFAITHAANVADAAHDEGLVRAVGLGWTGALRALDIVPAAALAWLPVGTRAFRASLATAMVCGAAGGLLFFLARRLLAACAPAPRLGPAIAAIASTTATLSAAWQMEAASPGGAVLGALLVFLPPVLLLQDTWVQSARFALAAAALTLGLTYEPMVGATALAGSVAVLAATREWPRGKGAWRAPGAGVVAGLVPLALAIAGARGIRRPGLALGAGLLASPLGEHGASGTAGPLLFLRDEVGWLSLALALVGAVVALTLARARPAALASMAIVLSGAAALAVGAPAGDTRYGAPVLAAIGALGVLAGVAMQSGVRAVATARVPFAQASAVMIVVLEATFPVRAADEADARTAPLSRGIAAAWDDVAWGPLPAGALVMVSDPRLLTRLLASRASGAVRGDLAVVPTWDLDGPLATRELVREPKLSAFWRDMALLSAPDEWSLSSLAASRPLVMQYEPRWDRALSRHLVPVGLLARYEAEPRGMSDRRRAIEELSTMRPLLVRDVVTARDPELASLTASLLRGRALALAASGDRELVAHAIDDLRAFSPGDPVGAELVRRMVGSGGKGPIDLKGLSPTQ